MCIFEAHLNITMMPSDLPKADMTDDSLQTSLSLQIHCLATELVEETFCSLKNNATPEDIALAIISLKAEWPTQGHLIIVVNPQHNTKQVFLPEKLVCSCFVLAQSSTF
jgi:hypothetical protein